MMCPDIVVSVVVGVCLHICDEYNAMMRCLTRSLPLVVASDRSLGGFCHSWGEDQPKVQKKKRMLEEEGIKFEPDGKKILNEYFVNHEEEKETKVSSTAKKRKGKTAKKQQPAATATDKVPSIPNSVDEITEEMLKQEILSLLNKRAVGKTC